MTAESITADTLLCILCVHTIIMCLCVLVYVYSYLSAGALLYGPYSHQIAAAPIGIVHLSENKLPVSAAEDD